jgi:hypothetical protein
MIADFRSMWEKSSGRFSVTAAGSYRHMDQRPAGYEAKELTLNWDECSYESMNWTEAAQNRAKSIDLLGADEPLSNRKLLDCLSKSKVKLSIKAMEALRVARG